MHERCDVLVAGGGVAGSLISFFLASSGFEVILLEQKSRDDTMKVCGDAIGKHHFDNVGIPHPSGEELAGTFKGVKVVAPNEKDEVIVGGEGYALNRPLFIKRLRKMALDAGAELLDKHAVLKPIVDGSWLKGLEVFDLRAGERKEIEATVTIDATGVPAVVRSRLPAEWPVSEKVPPEDYDVCYREIIEMDGVETGYAVIYLSTVIAPGGYWWWFPKNERTVNVGLGVKGGGSSPNPQKNYEKYVRPKLGRIKLVIHAGGGICPTRRTISCMVWNGFVAVGDAACTANPIHGGGMGPAMLSAKSAAQAIEEALSREDPSVKGLWSYQNRYMELYGAKQAGLDVLRMYLQLMSDEELNFVFEKGVISSADVGEIGYKGDLGSTLISKVSSAIRLLSRPSLLARLKKVKDYMDKARELYYSYPKSPEDFKRWKIEVDELFEEYRSWLQGS
ncbi:MAG: hypothetical protein DRO05_08050 [Thermoproteota archaeon]|nr:MAG: hypothetical protein DRO05_08050 [Candidatus Korarchaeota archaeon]